MACDCARNLLAVLLPSIVWNTYLMLQLEQYDAIECFIDFTDILSPCNYAKSSKLSLTFAIIEIGAKKENVYINSIRLLMDKNWSSFFIRYQKCAVNSFWVGWPSTWHLALMKKKKTFN